MTGAIAVGILLAHLWGDYVFQSHWMAISKTSRWWPAVLHGLTYTLPYVLVTRSPWALLVIGGTHIVIDRYRLARYLVWMKNQMGPKRHRPPWPPTATGYAPAVTNGFAVVLMIIADNTLHLTINFAAVLWL